MKAHGLASCPGLGLGLLLSTLLSAIPLLGGAGEGEAHAELASALALRHAMRGTEGDEREEARGRAVDALRAVRREWPGERAICAEAAFRAGELLRAGRENALARAEFEWARELGHGTRFRARSILEIGHIHRREGRAEAALDLYCALVADPVAQADYRDEASLWAGRVWLDMGARSEALRAWQRVALSAEDPLDRIRAFDYLAMESIHREDLEGAAGILHRCREALADASAEETKLGIRVRKSLAHMRALERLRVAIAARAHPA